MDTLTEGEKLLLRQLTLQQLRTLDPQRDVVIRLAIEEYGRVDLYYLGHGTVAIERQERKRMGPLIKRIYPVAPAWAAGWPVRHSERFREGEGWMSWAAEEGTLEDGTFFESALILRTMQLFAPDGLGRSLAEVERYWALDVRLRKGGISRRTYDRLLAEAKQRELGEESPS